MKITKRQLKRIIKEEKHKILKEQGMPGIEGPVRDLWGSQDDDKIDADHEIDKDMRDLLSLAEKVELKAKEIRTKMEDHDYGDWAGGREADDLGAALHRVWIAFGMEPEDMFQ